MRSERQIQASRANGSIFRGPVTAQVLFADHESDRDWNDLLASYVRELQLQTEIELALVETIALSVWRWTQPSKREPAILARTLTLSRFDSRCTREHLPVFKCLNELRTQFPQKKILTERTQQITENKGPRSKTNPPSGSGPHDLPYSETINK
ncbi:MAG: hypothetical protein ABSG41_17905 [Bryobacteraceae bacterium]|jgi:hypothetical protein